MTKDQDEIREYAEKILRGREINTRDETDLATHLLKALEENERMRDALKPIARKNPNKVGRFEAADMAVEFHMGATKVLASLTNDQTPPPKTDQSYKKDAEKMLEQAHLNVRKARER